MFKILLALHLLFAIFAVGPLVHAASVAGRGVRRGDAELTASSSRLLRVYSLTSVLVVVVGFGLMSTKFRGQRIADFGDTWIWLSVLLWVMAMGLVHGLLVPTLDKVTETIKAEGSVVALTLRVTLAGGAVGLIFAGIVFLMVYRPGR